MRMEHKLHYIFFQLTDKQDLLLNNSLIELNYIVYRTTKVTHLFSNAFNMVLTLNFCILKVTCILKVSGAICLNLC